MAKPTLVTSQALEGIAAQVGEEILVADDATTFQQHIRDVLAGRYPNMGESARERVLRDFSWSGNLRVLDELLKNTAQFKPEPGKPVHQAAAQATPMNSIQ